MSSNIRARCRSAKGWCYFILGSKADQKWPRDAAHVARRIARLMIGGVGVCFAAPVLYTSAVILGGWEDRIVTFLPASRPPPVRQQSSTDAAEVYRQTVENPGIFLSLSGAQALLPTVYENHYATATELNTNLPVIAEISIADALPPQLQRSPF